jgi:hypothetical protein
MQTTIVIVALAISVPVGASPVVWQPASATHTCDATAKRVARELHVRDVRGCSVATYRHQADTLALVALDVGEVTDCEAGCVQRRVAAVVRSTVVTRTIDSAIGRPDLYSQLRPWLLQQITAAGAVPANYDFFDADGFCAQVTSVDLASDGDAVYWTATIAQRHCGAFVTNPGRTPTRYAVELSGELRSTIPAAARDSGFVSRPRADTSRLAVILLRRF